MLRPRSALFLAVVVVAGCDVRVGEKGDVSVDIAQGKATDEWVRSYSVAPGGRVDIVNVDGAIDVAAATGDKVEVRAVREARANSDEAARELLAGAEILEQVAAQQVKVESRSTRRGGLRSLGRTRVSVQYKVLVPAGLSVSFRTQNGHIRLDNIDGRVEAATTNGTITGRDLSGSVTAATVNGSVQMGLSALSGDVSLTAVNGGIRIEVPPTIDAQLEASTVNGGVTIDEALSLAAEDRSRQHVAGRINKGGRRITAQTTNGAVRVMIRAPRAE